MLIFTWSLIVVAVIVVGLGMWIGVPMFIRWLGDRAILWFRLPENYGCFVTKDKKLVAVFIASSDAEKVASMKSLIKGTEYEKLFKFVGEGLIWVGLPWFGYELQGWYELSADDDNPDTDPRFILYLGERTWDYTTPESASEAEKKEFIKEWGVDTADPIQVTPKLVATAEVIHPIKAIFNVKYFQEAILKEILTGWRQAVYGLEYFTYSEKKEDGKDTAKIATGASGTLHANAQKNLDKFLFGEEEMKKNTKPESYAAGTPAKMIYDVYGIWLKRVRIRDIDPTQSKIRDNLEEKIIAQTKAAAQVETAKGDRDAKQLRADGQVYETTEVGKAEAGVISMKLSAKGEGLKNISEKLKLKEDENKILYAADMAVQMAENSQYTYLAGMPGDIGSWIIAAADQMRGGFQKLKAGANGDTKMGFDEIKKAFSELEPKKQEELLKLAEKTKEVKGKEGDKK